MKKKQEKKHQSALIYLPGHYTGSNFFFKGGPTWVLYEKKNIIRLSV